MFQTNAVEKIKTHFGFSNFFFNRAFYEIMWKNKSTAELVTDKTMAHAHFMLDY